MNRIPRAPKEINAVKIQIVTYLNTLMNNLKATSSSTTANETNIPVSSLLSTKEHPQSLYNKFRKHEPHTKQLSIFSPLPKCFTQLTNNEHPNISDELTRPNKSTKPTSMMPCNTNKDPPLHLRDTDNNPVIDDNTFFLLSNLYETYLHYPTSSTGMTLCWLNLLRGILNNASWTSVWADLMHNAISNSLTSQ